MDTSGHESFEQLCTLLAIGDADQDQQACMDEHLRVCQQCRLFLRDVTRIGGELLERSADPNISMPAGMTERFIARARTEGVPLSSHLTVSKAAPNSTKSKSRMYWFPVCATVACTLVAVLFVAGARRSWFSTPALTSPHLPVPEITRVGANPDFVAENARILKEVEITNKEVSTLRENIKNVDSAKGRLEAEKADVETRLLAAERESSASRRSLAQGEEQRRDLERRLEQIDSERTADLAAAQVEQQEISKLQKQVEDLQSELSEQQQLLAQANEAKELITARRLHLVDVFDHDSNPKTLKPFGRIYYAEGRKLVFYAYDLGDPRKLNTTITFYLWGQRQADGGTVKLGIFHNDDPKDRRWVVDCGNSQVLATIDSVFVTVERKAVEQPNGRRILDAFLGQPNHP